MALSETEINRYQRHLSLPQIGTQGQKQLQAARVLCVGIGGLGAAVLPYLAAAGVGRLGIVDFDTVDISNLQRQVIYTEDDVGQSKVNVAKNKLTALNSEIIIKAHEMRLDEQNALDLFENYDIVVDGSDNFSTRYLINDACFELKKPHVFASIYQFEGQCAVFNWQDGPCYRCLFPEVRSIESIPDCNEAGVLGVLPGMMGMMQANEVIKLICQIGKSLAGRLLTVNALDMKFHEYVIQKNPNCVLCIHGKLFSELSRNAAQCQTDEIATVTVKQLKQMIDKKHDFLLVDVRKDDEYQLKNIGGFHVPLSDLPNKLDQLPKNKMIVMHCKRGGGVV